jgi:hypothetical protein
MKSNELTYTNLIIGTGILFFKWDALKGGCSTVLLIIFVKNLKGTY